MRGSPHCRTGRYTNASSSFPLTGGRIIGLGLASALKYTYTLQHNQTAATWLSTSAIYRRSTPRHVQLQRHLEARRARNEHARFRARSYVRARSRYAITHLTAHPVLSTVTNESANPRRRALAIRMRYMCTCTHAR